MIHVYYHVRISTIMHVRSKAPWSIFVCHRVKIIQHSPLSDIRCARISGIRVSGVRISDIRLYSNRDWRVDALGWKKYLPYFEISRTTVVSGVRSHKHLLSLLFSDVWVMHSNWTIHLLISNYDQNFLKVRTQPENNSSVCTNCFCTRTKVRYTTTDMKSF